MITIIYEHYEGPTENQTLLISNEFRGGAAPGSGGKITGLNICLFNLCFIIFEGGGACRKGLEIISGEFCDEFMKRIMGKIRMLRIA